MPAISMALSCAMLALFLCVLASVFGSEAGASWFALPPDYTPLGWGIRLTGATVGLGAFIYLSIVYQHYRSQPRKRRSHPSRVIKSGLLIAAASITWEIAILATVVLSVIALVYMMFGEDGI